MAESRQRKSRTTTPKSEPAVVEEVKTDDAVTEDAVVDAPREAGPEEASEPVLFTPEQIEYLNEHIAALTRHQIDLLTEGIDQRFRDIEQVVASPMLPVFAGDPATNVDDPIPYSVVDDVPEYKPSSEEAGGVPWFRG